MDATYIKKAAEHMMFLEVDFTRNEIQLTAEILDPEGEQAVDLYLELRKAGITGCAVCNVTIDANDRANKPGNFYGYVCPRCMDQYHEEYMAGGYRNEAAVRY